MRWFVGQSIKGGRCIAFSQRYKSRSFEKIFGTLSEEIKVETSKFDFFLIYVEYVVKQKKLKKNLILKLMIIVTLMLEEQKRAW